VRSLGRPVSGSTTGLPIASIIGSCTSRAPNLEREAMATSSAVLIGGACISIASEEPVGCGTSKG